jgi:iron complex outermembrane receptor protein
MSRTVTAIHRRRRLASLATLMTSTILAGASAAVAQEQKPPASSAALPEVQEVIVTAEKRAESIQHVAASIQALDSRKLEQLNITELNDYVKFLPSVAIQTLGPNQSEVYFRGIANGEDGNHSGPLPSVGVYLDETPITTIGGTIDVHVYDVARVEALAGPQGTLYGASSEAGTMRIITNKPSTAGFSAGYDVQGNAVANGGAGYVAEGFVNVPVTSNAAIRLVGWSEHDAGYINNIPGERNFATSGGQINNDAYKQANFNPNDTFGGRAELKVDLDSNWSITPMIVAQDTRNTGVFGYEPAYGALNVERFQPDSDHDRFILGALTIAGKIGKFDVTYAGSEFVRKINSQEDYSDYSVFYDGVYGSGANWLNNAGAPLANPSQEIVGIDHFTKESHELRIASPSTDRFRFIAGLFAQRQTHWIIQDYEIQGLSSQLSVPGWPNAWWLTDQMRIDRDYAAFTEMSYDLTDHLTVTGGVRLYSYDNFLGGFYGFGAAADSELNAELGLAPPYSASNPSSPGMLNCFGNGMPRGAPCVDLKNTSKGQGETHKLNVTYKFDPNRLVYATYSTGYRPGGANRNGALPPYGADYLTNYEIGWKTSWFDHRFTFNGAVFYEDWSNMQFSFLGQYSLTVIANAGEATVKGVETDFNWRVTDHFNIGGAASYQDARLAKDYCKDQGVSPCPAAADAPVGTQLPVTPPFKGDLTGRYTFGLADWAGHLQGALNYTDARTSSLLPSVVYGVPGQTAGLGVMPSYITLDFGLGIERNGLGLELFVKNATNALGQVSRSTPCNTCVAEAPGLPPPSVYVFPITPRLIGVKLSQKF